MHKYAGDCKLTHKPIYIRATVHIREIINFTDSLFAFEGAA